MSVVSIVVAGLLVVSIVLIIAAPNLQPFPVGNAFDLGDRLADPFDGVPTFGRWALTWPTGSRGGGVARSRGS